MLRLVTNVGEVALQFVHETGGVSLVLGRLCKRLFRFKIDGDEFFRSMRSYGEQSLLIIMLTAAFTGVIMVLQTAVYVKKFGVYDLVGWFAGFSTFREVAPLLIGLMFSGRVGANNCSELATMRITEQLDALRILALDVYELMILPRTLAMVLSMGVLTVFGNLMAVLSGALSPDYFSTWNTIHSFSLSLTVYSPRTIWWGSRKHWSTVLLSPSFQVISV